MYIKQGCNPLKKFYIIWKVRSNNSGDVWLTKEDCPGTVHNSFEAATIEADRLCNKTQGSFVVMESIGVMSYQPPQPQITSKFNFLTKGE